RIVERWYPKERCVVGERRVSRTATNATSTAATSATVSHASASRPREWARNPKATRTPTSTRLSPSTTWRRVSRFMLPRVRASPTQLSQAGVVDAEVVADLMDDDAAHLLDDLLLVARQGADWHPVDGDAIGHEAR